MSSGAPLRPWPGRSTAITRRPASRSAATQPVSSQFSLLEDEKPWISRIGRRPASVLGSCTATYSWGSVPATVWECCSPVCLPLIMSVLIEYGAQADPALWCLFLRDCAHDAGGVVRHLKHNQGLADIDLVAGPAVDTHHLTRLRAWQFNSGFRGFHLDERLVALDLVAGGDQPFQDGRLDEAFAEVGQREGNFSHVGTPIPAGCRKESGRCWEGIRPQGPRPGTGRRSRSRVPPGPSGCRSSPA